MWRFYHQNSNSSLIVIVLVPGKDRCTLKSKLKPCVNEWKISQRSTEHEDDIDCPDFGGAGDGQRSTRTVACDDASITTCSEGQDTCVSSTVGFKVDLFLVSSSTVQSVYACGTRDMEDAGDSVCDGLETASALIPGFKDFTCETNYCGTDLCNDGQSAPISLSSHSSCSIILLIALLGLFFWT